MDNDCKVSRWAILKNQLNNLTPKEFKSMVESSENIVLLDCRKPEEFATGKLYNALNIDYLGEGFLEKMETLDIEKTYLIYCRSGRRSIRTCTLLKNGGFKNIYNLSGGLNAWNDALGIEGLN